MISIHNFDGGVESRHAGTTASLDRGGGPARVKTASEVSAPVRAGRALDGSGASPLPAKAGPKVRPLVVNRDIAGLAPGPSDALRYIYHWHRMDRKDQACAVLVRTKVMNSCLVQFEDGFTAVTSRNALRRHKMETAS